MRYDPMTRYDHISVYRYRRDEIVGDALNERKLIYLWEDLWEKWIVELPLKFSRYSDFTLETIMSRGVDLITIEKGRKILMDKYRDQVNQLKDTMIDMEELERGIKEEFKHIETKEEQNGY